MAVVHLLFAGTPLTQPADLVFGDSDIGGVVIDATITGGDHALPALPFESAVVLGIPVAGGDLALPDLPFESEVVYYTDTRRPLVGKFAQHFQDGTDLRTGVQDGAQDATRLPVGVDQRFQDGVALQAGAEQGQHDAQRLHNAARSRFQDGVGEGTRGAVRFQNATKAPLHRKSTFQQALARDGALTGIRFQDGTKVRNQAADRFQDALPYSIGVTAKMRRGKALQKPRSTRYQDAIRPPAGISLHNHGGQPAGDPCYLPDGHLVFSAPWVHSGDLLFFCERHPPVEPPVPGETVVVPIKRVYVVLNEVSLRRVEGNIPLPTINMNMSLDVDSWTWSFGATLPIGAKQYVEPNGSGDPVEVEAMINGVPYRMLVESLSRDRTFGQESLKIGGRGLSATLDSPYSPIMNFGNAGLRTAQQLMGDVLTLNGVPLDWTVDWQIEDWNVPGGIWTAQGSYIGGLQSIVQSVGGYLQPVPSAKTLRALLRYPTLPRDWGDVTPDYELPSAVTTREAIEWQERARYNRAHVSGIQDGVLGQITLAGTDGALAAPMVTDSLILSGIPARQRGVSILGNTGRIANISLRLPVLEETGVIPPGKFVLYTDGGVERIGITRAVSLDVALPEVFQTLQIETHELPA